MITATIITLDNKDNDYKQHPMIISLINRNTFQRLLNKATKRLKYIPPPPPPCRLFIEPKNKYTLPRSRGDMSWGSAVLTLDAKGGERKGGKGKNGRGRR